MFANFSHDSTRKLPQRHHGKHVRKDFEEDGLKVALVVNAWLRQQRCTVATTGRLNFVGLAALCCPEPQPTLDFTHKALWVLS